MQIHEVTKPAFKEGLFDTPAKVAADAAAKLTSQGYGSTYRPPSDKWEDKYAKVLQDPNIKQYVKGLSQGWSQQHAQLSKLAAVTAPVKPSAPSAQEPPAMTLGGKKLDPKNPNDAKVIAMMKAQGKLQEAPAEYTTPGGIVVPAGAKTDKTLPPTNATPTVPADTYQQRFQEWMDAQLASRDPVTRQPITMDDVRGKFPDLSNKLDQFLKQIANTQGTPQQSAAVEEYAKLAVSGVQALAQTSRNKEPAQRTTDLGVSSQQLASLRALGQTPAGKELLIRQLGL